MSGWVIVVETAFSFVTAGILLFYYGDVKRQHRISSIATFVSWVSSFLILFLIPVDISSTLYRQCLHRHSSATSTTVVPPTATTSNHSFDSMDEIITVSQRPAPHDAVLYFTYMKDNVTECVKPWVFVDDHTLQILWHFIYWSSQVLTWIALPLIQSYALSGEFSPIQKLKSSLRTNAIYYGTYLSIFCVLLVYVVSKVGFSLSQLKLICITASNTWGLFLLVLLLGYGLVEVPRSMWNRCNHTLALARTYFKISKLSAEKNEVVEQLEDVLEKVVASTRNINGSHPSRCYLDIILEKCPESMMRSSFPPATPPGYQDSEEVAAGDNESADTSERYLAKLHSEVIRSLQAYHRTQAQWELVVVRGLHLEDEVANLECAEKKFSRSALTSGTTEPFLGQRLSMFISTLYSRYVEWYWRCLLRPFLLRVLACFCALVSILVVWSEITFFNTSPVLSVFAVAVKSATDLAHHTTALLICGFTVFYLSLTAFFTVFRIRIFNYYYIAGDHLTDENSLLFIGMLLSRLTPPLCLNFLGLIHLDGDTSQSGDDTSFTRIMGRLQLIPFIAKGFNVYFPILILLLCFATYFSLGSRLLHLFGCHQFIGEDEMTQDFIDEGRTLLQREKRLRLRQVEQGGARRRYRYGVYYRMDPTEAEGFELRSQGLSSRSKEDSPLRSNTSRKTRPKNYGTKSRGESSPLLRAHASTSSEGNSASDLT